MSEPALALGGKTAEGAARIEEQASPGMIALRGAFDVLAPAIGAVVGMAMPETRGIVADGARRLLWMSPDELLLLVPRDEVGRTLGALSERLAGSHHLALDVSDMRSVFRISGGPAREMLAKLAPADLHPDSFGPGELRRTRLAQVPCAFWLEDDGFRLVCFRSVARYVFDLLAQASGDGAVGHLPPG